MLCNLNWVGIMTAENFLEKDKHLFMAAKTMITTYLNEYNCVNMPSSVVSALSSLREYVTSCGVVAWKHVFIDDLETLNEFNQGKYTESKCNNKLRN